MREYPIEKIEINSSVIQVSEIYGQSPGVRSKNFSRLIELFNKESDQDNMQAKIIEIINYFKPTTSFLREEGDFYRVRTDDQDKNLSCLFYFDRLSELKYKITYNSVSKELLVHYVVDADEIEIEKDQHQQIFLNIIKAYNKLKEGKINKSENQLSTIKNYLKNQFAILKSAYSNQNEEVFRSQFQITIDLNQTDEDSKPIVFGVDDKSNQFLQFTFNENQNFPGLPHKFKCKITFTNQEILIDLLTIEEKTIDYPLQDSLEEGLRNKEQLLTKCLFALTKHNEEKQQNNFIINHLQSLAYRVDYNQIDVSDFIDQLKSVDVKYRRGTDNKHEILTSTINPENPHDKQFYLVKFNRRSDIEFFSVFYPHGQPESLNFDESMTVKKVENIKQQNLILDKKIERVYGHFEKPTARILSPRATEAVVSRGRW